MSAIVDFRQRVIDAVKATAPELDVDWFDGLFDEEDVKEWTLKPPSARVAVMNVPTEHHTTGEMNACLRVVVVIIDENRYTALDSDARAWDLVERVAIMANLNKFDDPNAGPACKVQFKRLSDPQMRRDGITIGVVEWRSDLMIGINRSRAREYIYYNDRQVTQVPRSRVTGRMEVELASGATTTETLDITPED